MFGESVLGPDPRQRAFAVHVFEPDKGIGGFGGLGDRHGGKTRERQRLAAG